MRSQGMPWLRMPWPRMPPPPGCPARRTMQDLPHPLQPLRRAARLRGTSRGHAGGDEPRASHRVVPGDDPVVQPKHRVGKIEIVVSRHREPLQGGTVVVGEKAGDAALEWGEVRNRVGGMRREKRLRLIERRRASPAFGPDQRHRRSRKKRIAAEPLRIGGAVEKEQLRLTQKSLSGLDGQRSRGELLHERLIRHRRRRLAGPGAWWA